MIEFQTNPDTGSVSPGRQQRPISTRACIGRPRIILKLSSATLAVPSEDEP